MLRLRLPGIEPLLAAVALVLSACAVGGAGGAVPPGQSSGQATSGPPRGGFDLPVSHPTLWLCHPDQADDPCTAGADATVVAADGSTRVDRSEPARRPAVDCFYVYPTVSLSQEANAPLAADGATTAVARTEASRFSEHCRVFAPVYRQITLAALTRPELHTPENLALAYEDVRSAWNDYLNTENHGRGVVVIGHSQGGSLLTKLIQEQIEPDRRQRGRVVSAYLLGANIEVPVGEDVGGDFAELPLCRRSHQLGCVVAYGTYEGTPPPLAEFSVVGRGARFLAGTPSTPGTEVACVNPAALRGGAAVTTPYLPSRDLVAALPAYSPELPDAPTPFVAYRDLLRAECRSDGEHRWLNVEQIPAPGDTRALPPPAFTPEVGLHMFDFSVLLDDLVELVGGQAATWERVRD